MRARIDSLSLSARCATRWVLAIEIERLRILAKTADQDPTNDLRRSPHGHRCRTRCQEANGESRVHAGSPVVEMTMCLAPVASSHTCVGVRVTQRTTPSQLGQRTTVPMP